MPVIEDIGHIILQVGDMEDALKFYRDVLGFEVEGREHPIWTAVTVKGGSLTLLKAKNPVPCVSAENGSPINLHVRDFDEAARVIEGKGCTVHRRDGNSGFLRDPWGNILWLHDHRDE